MIAELPVGMENRSAALLTLPNQFGSAPDAKMLSLAREREGTPGTTDSIFIGGH